MEHHCQAIKKKSNFQYIGNNATIYKGAILFSRQYVVNPLLFQNKESLKRQPFIRSLGKLTSMNLIKLDPTLLLNLIKLPTS